MYNVIVTRPEPKNQALCQLLMQSGYTPYSVPLIQRVPFDFLESTERAAVLRETLLNIDTYDSVVCISQPAAEWLANGMDHYWPATPVGVDWWVLGESSAKPLRDIGLAVNGPISGNNSEALLAMPALAKNQVEEQRWLLVQGGEGRRLLKETLLNRKAKVEVLDVYARQPIEYDSAALANVFQTLTRLEAAAPIVQMATSIELLHAWWQLLMSEPAQIPLRERLVQSPILVISERIKREAIQLGFEKVIIAEKPDNQTLVKSLKEVNHAN